MLLEELSELGLIQRIRRKERGILKKSIRVGIGDDAAVVKPSFGKLSLLTVDTLVEGVHFDLKLATYREVGERSMISNLSDIAAMGGKPIAALVSLALPASTSVEVVDELYRGLRNTGQKYGIKIIGGDTVLSPILTISLTLWGEVKKQELVLRSGAQVGDAILVTGDLGGSLAGLEALRRELPLERRTLSYLRKRYISPTPRVREARILVENIKVHAMIDISDGLASEINHIAKESGVGAKIYQNQIPIARETKRVAEILGKSAYDFALYGGEDFELLFTLPQKEVKRVVLRMKKKATCALTLIGEIVPQREGVNLIYDSGGGMKLLPQGYNHFKRKESNA